MQRPRETRSIPGVSPVLPFCLVTTAPLGVEDLSVLLKHTPDWVRAQCRAGKLPHHKIGKLYVFTAEDVAEIFDAARRPVKPAVAESTPVVRGRRRRYPTYMRIDRAE